MAAGAAPEASDSRSPRTLAVCDKNISVCFRRNFRVAFIPQLQWLNDSGLHVVRNTSVAVGVDGLLPNRLESRNTTENVRGKEESAIQHKLHHLRYRHNALECCTLPFK
jgi:hypothetical protein